MSIGYYDMDGQPLTLQEWVASFGSNSADRGACRVAETTLPSGTWISTVLLGLDHQYGDGPPLIFESMVFSSRKDMDDLDMDRYSTKEQAQAGHGHPGRHGQVGLR